MPYRSVYVSSVSIYVEYSVTFSALKFVCLWCLRNVYMYGSVWKISENHLVLSAQKDYFFLCIILVAHSCGFKILLECIPFILIHVNAYNCRMKSSTRLIKIKRKQKKKNLIFTCSTSTTSWAHHFFSSCQTISSSFSPDFSHALDSFFFVFISMNQFSWLLHSKIVIYIQ